MHNTLYFIHRFVFGIIHIENLIKNISKIWFQTSELYIKHYTTKAKNDLCITWSTEIKYSDTLSLHAVSSITSSFF